MPFRGNALCFFRSHRSDGSNNFKEDPKLKKENRLLTIDGETLMSQPLTPLNFVVDTLLSQGLHILAGSPKVGKSWLALWLAVTVAKGEAVWGMGVKQGTTLYLCLEDSTLRIQNRLFEITEDAPAISKNDANKVEILLFINRKFNINNSVNYISINPFSQSRLYEND